MAGLYQCFAGARQDIDDITLSVSHGRQQKVAKSNRTRRQADRVDAGLELSVDPVTMAPDMAINRGGGTVMHVDQDTAVCVNVGNEPAAAAVV